MSKDESLKLEIQTPEVFGPLLDPARYLGAYGGRGSGKSHFFGELLVETAYCNPGFRAVCVREVQKSLKESAKRLIEDKMRALGLQQSFRVLNDRIETPGDGIIIFQGMQDHTADSVKSLEGFDVAWIEEAQTLSHRSLELLRPTIRKPGSQIWASWNPDNEDDAIDQFLRVRPPDDSIVVRANYSDNPWFPQELEAERQHDEKNFPDRYGHIWLGDYAPTALGAIWGRGDFERYRMDEAPPLARTVVAVDPAVTSTDVSDEHGIIVAALGEDKRGYVLEDATTSGTPNQWAERVWQMVDKWEADAVVIEVNQGGDMVKHTLKSVRNLSSDRIVEVRATRGKHVRAEPISALYSEGKVSHVGFFPELERQMCRITPAGYDGEDSPDRADAMVWAFTELFPKMVLPDRKPSRKRSRRSSWMG